MILEMRRCRNKRDEMSFAKIIQSLPRAERPCRCPGILHQTFWLFDYHNREKHRF